MEARLGDDGSERSPEPLRERPPRQTIPLHCQTVDYPFETLDVDDGSAVISLPDPPSDCSPPSSSVYSNEDLPVKSIRKTRPPLQEVHLDDLGYVRDFVVTPAPGRSFASFIPSNMMATPAATTTPDFLVPAIRHLKSDLQESQQSIFLLQEENKCLTMECNKYETALQERQRRINRLESEAKEKEEQWSANISKIERQKDLLEKEKVFLRDELNELKLTRDKWVAVVEEKKIAPQNMDTLSSESDSENQTLAKGLREANERATVAEAKQDELLKQLAELQGQMDRLQTRLERAETNLSAVEQERDSLKKSLFESESSRNSPAITELQGQIASLTKELYESSQTNESLRSRLNDLQRNEAVRNTQNFSNAAVQTEFDVFSLPQAGPVLCDANLAGRLARIRDAAERASVLQDLRRELSHLKSEHDARIRQMEHDHDAALRKVIHEAKTEVHRKTKNYKDLLINENEAKIDAIERRHQAELEELKDECERTIRISNETVHAAVKEVESISRDLEAKRLRILELEEALVNFNLKLDESRLLNRGTDAFTLKEEWQSEAAVLVDRIRTACDSILQEHVAHRVDHEQQENMSHRPIRMTHKSASALLTPISVNGSPFGSSPRSHSPANAVAPQRNRFFGNQDVFQPTTSAKQPPRTSFKAPLVSFSSSNLDQTLAETEALVMGLVGHA